MQKTASQIVLKPSPKAIKTTPKISQTDKPTNTAEIRTKDTSPTLVDFQSSEAQLPEWRLQLKNAVQKRMGDTESLSDPSSNTLALASKNNYPTNGGNALKAEVIEDSVLVEQENLKLASALKRIEQSRKKFFIVEDVQVKETNEQDSEEQKPAKEFPFTIASRTENPVVENEIEAKSDAQNKIKTVPTLVPEPIVEEKQKDLYDTSELDPEFISAKISSSFEQSASHKQANEVKVEATQKTKTKEETVTQLNELDDVAPFSLRFNAGLFDLIIASFASVILLAPFVLLGGNWFSIVGSVAFIVTTSIVLFIYMTATIGIFGKTFGMHLFTIEMIDYFEDEYPTFHQAAVSSSIFLLSITLGGIGFIPSLFDEDNRAAHDLISGTVVVKEF